MYRRDFLSKTSWRHLVYLLKQHTALYLDKVKFVREPRRSDNAHQHIHLPLSLCSLHSHTNNKHIPALVCALSLSSSMQFTISLGNPSHCWQFFLLVESVAFTVFENSASCMNDRTVTRRDPFPWPGLVWWSSYHGIDTDLEWSSVDCLTCSRSLYVAKILCAAPDLTHVRSELIGFAAPISHSLAAATERPLGTDETICLPQNLMVGLTESYPRTDLSSGRERKI